MAGLLCFQNPDCASWPGTSRPQGLKASPLRTRREAPSAITLSPSPCPWKKQECGTVTIAKMELAVWWTQLHLAQCHSKLHPQERPRARPQIRGLLQSAGDWTVAFLLTKGDL